MNFIRTFLLLTLFSFASELSAQIFPPDILCVSNDTIFWDLPTNSCGSFNAYDIFASQDINGPYINLAEINNPSTDFYFHNNANGTWYYYMTSDFDCPGEETLESDTIDNLSPLIPIIQNVTVDGNNVEVSWGNSASPEVESYIIYRSTNIGVIPIDTIFNSNLFIDSTADPTSQPEIYYVLAQDACGNTSIFDDPHNTIFLESTVSECEQTISLTWNPSLNWDNGIEAHEVWVSINGDPAILENSLSATANNYVFENANDATTYCFTIQAVHTGGAIRSASSVLCQTLDIVQPMRNLLITNATVDENNDVEVEWIWDINAEVNYFELQTGNTVLESGALAPPLNFIEEFLHDSANPNEGPIPYQVQTTDDCDSIKISNNAATIFLTSEANENQSNLVNWTAFNIEGAYLLEYELFRLEDGDETSLGIFAPGDQMFLDPVDIGNDAQTNLCYFVIAYAQIVLPNGNLRQIETRSNTFCAEQPADMYVPNAIAPAGRNWEFRPVVIFGTTSDYTLQIFDRYGQMVFESRDIDKGWNGKKGGEFMRAGAYTYLIQLIQQNGREVVRKGVVVLIY